MAVLLWVSGARVEESQGAMSRMVSAAGQVEVGGDHSSRNNQEEELGHGD